jgi:three-Cys-motif partner protein
VEPNAIIVQSGGIVVQMRDNLPAVWERPAHTSAKHEILQAYLKAWIPIMSHQSYRVGATTSGLLFVDGFAGPGCYAQGEDGSPLLAIKSVLAHSLPIPVPLSFLFIEKDAERYRILEQQIQKLEREIKSSQRIGSITPKLGDCKTIINAFLDEREEDKQRVGPALFFLDQFGYSDVPMSLIGRIMSHVFCEVFSYLNWDHMHRFLTDESKWPSISGTFGGDEWKPVLGLSLRERGAFMLQTYRTALRTKAKARYVWQFTMSDEADSILYWLFFCTNNLRGLEEMKEAMGTVDSTGGFRFCDKDDPSQLHLFNEYTDESLATELGLSFRGKTVTVGEVMEFVLTETPACKFKGCLRDMEKTGRLRPIGAPPKRRKGTFADEQMCIEFLP